MTESKISSKLKEHFSDNLNSATINRKDWLYYLELLPEAYQEDLSFQLQFNWHIDASLAINNCSLGRIIKKYSDPAFSEQITLINKIGKASYQLDYQFRELIIFHAKTNLRNSTLLEVGGSLPNQLIFQDLGVKDYINIESPEYIKAESGRKYSDNHDKHKNKKTYFCNAENITKYVSEKSVNNIFSVAAFEHIHDLPKALSALHQTCKSGGKLFSYFTPIYSWLARGDHRTADHEKLPESKIRGIHLLKDKEQLEIIKRFGITSREDINEYMANLHFNPTINRLKFEEYEMILTESPFTVIELNRQDQLNSSKYFPEDFARIRKYKSKYTNVFTAGYRIFLEKSNLTFKKIN